MNIEIANRLVELRKKSGYSQEQLAEKLGLSRQAVSKWERAESSPDTDNLICLAKLYGVSLDELLNTDQPIEDIVRNVKEKEEEKSEEKPEGESNESPTEEASEPGEEGKKKKGRWEWSSIYDDRSGRNGIHVKGSDGEYVHVGWNGIHVKDGDDEVHIGPGGIHIHDSDSQMNVDLEACQRYRRRQMVVDTCWSLGFAVSVVAYLIFGFLYEPETGLGWASGWTFILFGMTLSSLSNVIAHKRFSEFAIWALIPGLYCFLGIMFGYWHPHWVMFFAVPVYYIFVSPLDKLLKPYRIKKPFGYYKFEKKSEDDEDEDDDDNVIDAE